MISSPAFRLAVSLAVAAMPAIPSIATAQQQPAAQAPAPAPATAKPKKPAVAKRAANAAAQASVPSGPTLLGQYGDWGAYRAVPGGNKVCFTLAKPEQSQTDPPNRPRNPAYLFVSSRPAENVKNEVSIVIGYPFKPGSDATVEIGPAKFAMYTQNDGAWIKNAAEEAHLIDAMRKGADLIVTGASSRGTQSTDRYTLKGLSQALDRTAQECK